MTGPGGSDHWRTSEGAEVDLVIETPTGLFPIEVKRSASVRTHDARHLSTFIEEYADKASAGILIYTGSSTYWLTERVLAVPLSHVLGEGIQTSDHAPRPVHTTFGSAREAYTYLRFALDIGCSLGLPLAGGGFEMVDPVLMETLMIYGEW